MPEIPLVHRLPPCRALPDCRHCGLRSRQTGCLRRGRGGPPQGRARPRDGAATPVLSPLWLNPSRRHSAGHGRKRALPGGVRGDRGPSGAAKVPRTGAARRREVRLDFGQGSARLLFRPALMIAPDEIDTLITRARKSCTRAIWP
jgi:hypothetical protein